MYLSITGGFKTPTKSPLGFINKNFVDFSTEIQQNMSPGFNLRGLLPPRFHSMQSIIIMAFLWYLYVLKKLVFKVSQ